jgi:TonB family protein
MRFRSLMLAGTTLAMLAASNVRARDWQSPLAQQPAPLTMGRLALLGARSDETFGRSLQAALRSPDAGLRAVAARLIDVGRIAALGPALAATLADEQDDRVAAEMLRAALRLDTPDSRAAVASYLQRSGPASLQAYAEHLARVSPDRLVDELPMLMTRLTDVPNDLDDILIMAGEQHLDDRERLTRTWMTHASGVAWRALLDDFPAAPVRPELNRILVDAAASADGAVREETVWRVVRWLAANESVDASVLDAAAAPTDDTGDWESIARELVRRRRGAEAVDRTGVLQQLGAAHAVDLFETADLPQWSTGEQRVVRTAIANGARKSQRSTDLPPVPVGTMATVRAADAPWPGFFSSLFEATGCEKTGTSTYGGLVVSYLPDGRPMSVGVDRGSLSPACQSALAALVGVVEIESVAAAATDARQWLIMTTQRDVVACADEPEPITSSAEHQEHPLLAENPKRKKSVQPIYPEAAQRAGLRGTVTILDRLSVTGCVRHARVVRSAGLSLDLAALDAVTQWHYEPAIVRGRPRSVDATINVTFVPRQ